MNTVKYAGPTAADTFRNPSASIWKDCPSTGIAEGIVDGIHLFDDFVDTGIPGTQTSAINWGRWAVYAGSGNWVNDDMPHSAAPVGGMGGVISVLTGDNAAGIIGTHSSPFSLSTTQTNGKLWFEARVATTSILTNAGQLFVGLGETAVTTYSATIPLGNANATSNAIALVGFNRLEDGLGVLNTSYADHATSWTNIQATAGAIAANTWIKLGIKFNPADTAGALRFYINGQETTTPMTKAALLALTHLDAKGLGPIVGFYGDSEGSDYVYVDWIRVSQVY